MTATAAPAPGPGPGSGLPIAGPSRRSREGALLMLVYGIPAISFFEFR